jgi:invasion protein IalB
MKILTNGGIIASFVLANIIITMPATLAIAQETENTSGKTLEFQPWQVRCFAPNQQGALICSMDQTLKLQKSGQKVMSAKISKFADEKLFLTLSLPHGVDLTKDVSIRIDALPVINQPVSWADQLGSYTELPIDAIFLQQLKAGNTLFIDLHARAGNILKLEMSLTGFSRAYEKL